MKNKFIRLLICFGSLLLVHGEVKAQSQADSSTFSAQTVANAFGYNGPLQITANHSSTQGQVNGQLFWSNIYKAPDNSFVPVVITLAAGKAILSDQLQVKLSAMSAQQSNAPAGAPPLCELVQLDDGSRGYAFLSGFGAGGSGYCAIITSADGKYDLVLKMNFPGNGEPIKQTESNKEYLAHVMNNKHPWDYFKTVLNRLNPVASQEYSNLQNSANGSGSTNAVPFSSPVAQSISNNPTSTTTPTSTPQPQTPSDGQTRIPWWLYGIVVFSLGLIGSLWYFLKIRK